MHHKVLEQNLHQYCEGHRQVHRNGALPQSAEDRRQRPRDEARRGGAARVPLPLRGGVVDGHSVARRAAGGRDQESGAVGQGQIRGVHDARRPRPDARPAVPGAGAHRRHAGAPGRHPGAPQVSLESRPAPGAARRRTAIAPAPRRRRPPRRATSTSISTTT